MCVVPVRSSTYSLFAVDFSLPASGRTAVGLNLSVAQSHAESRTLLRNEMTDAA